MKITRRQLRQLILREVDVSFDQLDDETQQAAVDALNTSAEREGGALGKDVAEEDLEAALDTEISPEDVESVVAAAEMVIHDDGDIVDTKGMAMTENNNRMHRFQLRELIVEAMHDFVSGKLS